MNKKATKKKGWISVLMSYAVYCKGKIIISVILSITSIMAGLMRNLKNQSSISRSLL